MRILISKRKNDLLSIELYNRQVPEDTVLISQCFASTDQHLDIKFAVASGSLFSALYSMKSSVSKGEARFMHLTEEYHTPLNSLQCPPIKKAALFKGALVIPSSVTGGTWSRSGVGSL